MIIVVLGMHRSGTSMVSGLLHKMGVNMGERLLKGGVSNPKGYFEDLDFLALNRHILKESDGSWNNPPLKKKLQKSIDKNQNKIKKIINIKNKKSKLWGWKEPRTVLTIDAYMNFLPPDETKFILIYRNPLTISYSLNKRKKNRLEIMDGLELASVYEYELAKFIKKYPKHKKLFLSYENILRDKEENIKKICKFINMKFDKTMCSFVDNKLDRSSIII